MQTTVTIADRLTSELLSMNPDVVLGAEFYRRLELLKVPTDGMEDCYESELEVLSNAWNKKYEIGSDATRTSLIIDRYKMHPAWFKRSVVYYQKMLLGNLPEPQMLTLSELALFADTATSVFYNPYMYGEEYSKLMEPFAKTPQSKGKYYSELEERTQEFGWTKEQAWLFSENEGQIVKRNTWVKTNAEAEFPSWNEKTVNLQYFGFKSI